jgi:hypothetical protein
MRSLIQRLTGPFYDRLGWQRDTLKYEYTTLIFGDFPALLKNSLAAP